MLVQVHSCLRTWNMETMKPDDEMYITQTNVDSHAHMDAESMNWPLHYAHHVENIKKVRGLY